MDRGRFPEADRAELMAGIEAARRQGYAFGGVSVDDTTRCFAICLPTPASGAPLVVAIAGPADRMEARRDELLMTLQASFRRWFPEAHDVSHRTELDHL